jgi:hypothetical protein
MVRTTGFLQHCDNALAWTSHLSMHVPATDPRLVVITEIAQLSGSNGTMTAVLRVVLAYYLTLVQRPNHLSQMIILWME